MTSETLSKTFYHKPNSNENYRMDKWLEQNKDRINILGQVTSAYSSSVIKTIVYYKEN
jgi:hypothetical protein